MCGNEPRHGYRGRRDEGGVAVADESKLPVEEASADEPTPGEPTEAGAEQSDPPAAGDADSDR